jgi:hypothetical protein
MWYKCPICGQKLARIDPAKYTGGMYLWCRKHKGEIEVKIEESQNQSQSRSTAKVDLVSQSQNQSQLVDTG